MFIDKCYKSHKLTAKALDLTNLTNCLQVIDFVDFEETFKLGVLGLKGGDTTPKTMKRKKPESISLLEPNRVRNVGKLAVIFFSFT